MSVYRVIDKLEAYVKQGTVLPLGYRVVSEEKLLELIEKLRSSLPEEVGRARTIAKNGDRLVREAQENAQAIVADASTQSTPADRRPRDRAPRARDRRDRAARSRAESGPRARRRRRVRRPGPHRPRRPPLRRARLGEEGHRSAHRREDARRIVHSARRSPTPPQNRSAPPSTPSTTRRPPSSNRCNGRRAPGPYACIGIGRTRMPTPKRSCTSNSSSAIRKLTSCSRSEGTGTK